MSDEQFRDDDEMEQWYEQHGAANHPFLPSEIQNQGQTVEVSFRWVKGGPDG